MSELRRSTGRIFRTRQGNLIEFPVPRGWIGGFGLSNGSDTAHDINIAAGQCRDSTDAFNIEQTATNPFVKKLDAKWAAGSGAGGLGTLQIDRAATVSFLLNGGSDDTLTIDTTSWLVTPEAGDTVIVAGSGSGNDGEYQVTSSNSTVISFATGAFSSDEASSAATIHMIVDNDTYHVFAIRADSTPGSAVDFGFDTSVTATNLLAESSYAYYRRLGSITTDGSADIYQFYQHGDMFALDLAADGHPEATVTLGTKTITLAGIPTGVTFGADISALISEGATFVVLRDGNIGTVATPTATDYDIETATGTTVETWNGIIWTNTSAQIKFHSSQNIAVYLHIQTRGWLDNRGKDL